MLVGEELEDRADEPPLNAVTLRHGDANNEASIHVFYVKGVVGAEDLRNVGNGEEFESVFDIAGNAGQLILRHVDIFLLEVVTGSREVAVFERVFRGEL